MSQENINELKEFIEETFNKQNAGDYSIFFCIFLFATIVIAFEIFKKYFFVYLQKQAKKSENKIDDALVDLVDKWTESYVVMSFASFIATETFPIGNFIDLTSRIAFLGIATFQILQSLEFTSLLIAKQFLFDQSKESDNIEANFRKGLKIALYSAGGIFLCDNIGLNVSSIVAGLGIGGFAIAFAAQAVLSDAIASISLFIDQPFRVGESVMINGHSGAVEKIGFKTTKIRSKRGELIVIPNGAVSSATIQNFSRTVNGSLNQETIVKINNETSTELVRKLPDLLFDALTNHVEFQVNEIYLISFGDYSIDFEIRYAVLNATSVNCRKALGKINQIVLSTLRKFEVRPPSPKTRVDLLQPLSS